MKIIQSILTKNPCYTAGRKITVKGLMLHSVGCPQPSAMAFIKQWNPPANGRQVCVHGFIDGNTGDVYQCLPWNHRGWHGGGSCNNTHIGIEMCEPSTIKYIGGSTFQDLNPAKTKEVVMRTYNAAVELFAFLCKEYNLNPLTDIISHAEGHKHGIASNHGDPEHLWKFYGLSMDSFRKAVQAQMTLSNGIVPPASTKSPYSASEIATAKRTVQTKAGLEDRTIDYLMNYQSGNDLIIKLAKAMK